MLVLVAKIIHGIELRRLIGAGHIARHFSLKNLIGRSHFEELGVDGKIPLKLILKKQRSKLHI